MAVINLASSEQYNKLISAASVTVALFSADWAEQCAQIRSVMLEIANDLPPVSAAQFIVVDAEIFPDLALKHQIDAVPTVIFFKAGNAIDRIDGVNIAALTAKCKEYAKDIPAIRSDGPDEQESLEDRLRKLINRAKVMIFMKGDRNAPRCGFSKQLIGIMNETGVAYDTFDILTDEAVRQGLKKFSDWPTYPQVYVKGELIGGLDIVKEMLESGELMDALNV